VAVMNKKKPSSRAKRGDLNTVPESGDCRAAARNDINLVYKPNPLTSHGRQFKALCYQHSETLIDFLKRGEIDFNRPMQVVVNDRVIAREQWDFYLIRERDLVQVRAMVQGGDDSDVYSTVLTIAVLVVAAEFGPAVNSVFGLSATSVVGGALITMGGMYLVSQMNQPPETGDYSFSPSPNYSISGSRNQSRLGQPMQLVIGRHRQYPDTGAKPLIVNKGGQWLYQTFHHGLSDVVLSDFKIGDTPLTAYDSYILRESSLSTGVLSRLGNEWPGNVDTLQGVALVFDQWSNPLTTSIDTYKIGIDISGINFYMKEVGPIPLRVDYLIQYRAVGDLTWIDLLGNDVLSGYGGKTVNHTFEYDVPQGQYEVRVKYNNLRSHQYYTVPSHQTLYVIPVSSSDKYVTHQLTWTGLKSYQPDLKSYPNQKRSGLGILATGQLNGVIDQFNNIASGRCEAWNGSAWVTQETSNPAWWYRYIAKGKFDANGQRLYGGGYSDAELDLDSIKAWGAWCTSKGLECNFIFDAPRNCFSMLSIIARCGRATLSWGTGKLGVVYDEGGLPVSAMFGMANIRSGTFKVNYLSGQLPDEIVINWINPALGYKQDTVRQSVPGVTNPNNPVTVDIPGITSEVQAGREANLMAAEQEYRTRVISWETDIEGLAVARGDVVGLSHDLTRWAQSGRLLSGTDTVLQLDKPVTFTAGQTHYIMIRYPDGTLVTRAVNYQAGEAESITLASALPSAPDADVNNPVIDYIWSFDPQATPGKKVKITDIKPLDEHYVRVTATDEVDAYYAAEFDSYTYVPASSSINLPQISNLKISTELVNTGSGYATKIYLNWDIEGDYGGAWVMAGFDDIAQEKVGETITQTFSFTAPERGKVDVTVTCFDKQGRYGGAAAKATGSQIFVGRDAPPEDPTGLTITELADGTRQLLPQVPAVPVDFAGFLFRARAGTSWTTWDQLSVANGGIDLHSLPVKSMPWETTQMPPGDYVIGVKLIDLYGNESVNAFLDTYAIGADTATYIIQALAAAAADATAKANAAQAAAELAAQNYADAQDALAVTTANAYADGIVTAEESRAIADAQAKADAAQTAAIAAAAADATAKANAAQAAAELAAQNYADAQDALAVTTANAYADGIVTAEEARAIADAQAKADAAQTAAIAAAAANAKVTAILKLYYQTAQDAQPATPATGAGAYNFVTKTLTPPAGWGIEKPTAGSGPVWDTLTTYSATGQNSTTDDGSNTFTAPKTAYSLDATKNAPDGGFQVATAFFITGRIFSTSASGSPVPRGIAFSPTGEKMYVVDSNNRGVYEFVLSTPWHIKTAVFNAVFSASTYLTAANVVKISPDGTKFYIQSIDDSVYQFSMSTPWNITTAAYVKSHSFTAQGTNFVGMDISTDGSKVYMLNGNSESPWQLYEYSLSTSWDIATASYVRSFTSSINPAAASRLEFNSIGDVVVISGYDGILYQYELSTPWNISTMAFSNNLYDASTELGGTTAIRNFTYEPNGFKMYIGNGNGTIYQYELDTH
jgi:hypothetical protein